MILTSAGVLAIIWCSVASVVESYECGVQITDFFHCLDIHYANVLQTKYPAFDQETFISKVSNCFTINQCATPDRFDRIDPIANVTPYSEIEIKIVLNPLWFSNSSDREYSGNEEKCMLEAYNDTVQLIQKCIRKVIPGFEFPENIDIPSRSDYYKRLVQYGKKPDELFDTVAIKSIRAANSKNVCPNLDSSMNTKKCLTNVFHQYQHSSFDHVLRIDMLFRELCSSVGVCMLNMTDHCQEKLKQLETQYEKCFGLKAFEKPVETAIRNRVEEECKVQHQLKKMCCLN
ncbi:Ribosomal RNA large subunit methyltransferase K/L [Trichinella spiralis]|uniref:Ribosomal RNA large subunit methyltransferase K/L n=1 Tax=Trichinella spiralis TaxID=6334 RepID=A0ABR3L2L0_TRISP